MPNAKQWKDIFSDTQNFPDDSKIALGESEVTLGDIRNLTKSEKDDLSKKMSQLELDRKNLEAAQITVAANLAKLVDSGLLGIDERGNLSAKQPTPPNSSSSSTNSEPDYNLDTYVGPIYKQVQQIQKSLNDFNETAKKLQSEIQGGRAIYENDRLQNAFSSFNDWPEGYNVERAAKEAAAQRLYDPYGRLDIAGLHVNLSKPLRFSQKEIDELVRKRAEEINSEKRVAAVAKPGSSLRQPIPANVAKFDDVVDAAAKDPEIMELLANINPVTQ